MAPYLVTIAALASRFSANTSAVPSQDMSRHLRELTEREVAVLQLIGRGRPSSAIAAELFLPKTTVKAGVTRIFTKLRLGDSAQAVVLAYETGLVTPHREPSARQRRQHGLSSPVNAAKES